MANFVIVIEANPELRSHFLKTIEPLLSPTEGLTVNRCESRDFCAIWATNSNAPVNYVSDNEGAGVVWGEAITHGEVSRINASQFRNYWKESNYQKLPTADGFYAAVVYHPDFGLRVTADLLGLFPIYYYTSPQVTLVASSPELFRHHPRFHTSFNAAGLVGILLTNGLFNGQTLLSNVQRLNAGHLLVCQPGINPQEFKQYLPFNSGILPDYTHLSFNEQLEILEESLDKTLARHTHGSKIHSLLLSGGLDSRMLAGFLHRQNVDTVAVTLGMRSDIERECAVSVARTLGFPHHTATIPFEEYSQYANKLVKWEHLANGANLIMGWGTHTHLSYLAPRVIAGYALDTTIGAKGAYFLNPKALSFDKCFTVRNQWGFTPILLEKLLRKEIFGDLVQDTLAEIKKLYESYSDIEFQRAWNFELYHRQRFHTGSSGWRLSFGAWPVLPVLDSQLLQTSAALPIETVSQRKAQIELVRSKFPYLARLPLDRNSFNIEPLQPSSTRKLLSPVFGLQRKLRNLQNKLGWERRYYYRVFDINNPGWMSVRQQAEPYREQVNHLFNSEIFNQILPPANVPIKLDTDGIISSSRIKNLMSLLLWSKDNL
jgi:asparagine synthase (glutamine-hydrolysing)